MNAAEQNREEEQFRKVERAMLYVDEAARRAAETADALKEDGAPGHLVAALETAAASIRGDHKRLIKSVYWRAPARSAQEELVPKEQTP